MASGEEENIDFTQLERELNNAIEADARYWRENDAKLRAVNQKVATYDEFRDIVKAAHLKPLDKGDKASLQNKPKSSIWNSLTPKKRHTDSDNNNAAVGDKSGATTMATPTMLQDPPPYPPLGVDRLPGTPHEFTQLWCALDISERLHLLRRMGASTLGHLFRTEIPVGVLGEVLQALLAFTPSTQEVVLVVGILEALTEAKRFGLSLQFLSSVEQTTGRQLLEKLESSLQDRQQDLAEEDVTEWTLQELRKKYQVQAQT